MILCPSCQSIKIVKNGKTYYGKQNHKCKDCGRQFVLNNRHYIKQGQREMIRKALNERISLLGICRVFSVSLPWLLDFAESVWKAVPMDIGLSESWLKKLRPKKAQLIVLQLDEAWSFVDNKSQKRWIWVAFDPVNRLVVAFHIGNRGKESAKALWRNIPAGYKHKCFFATDSWDPYKAVIPTKRHVEGKAFTYIIEGFWTGMRARVSRLVRKSLAFSKVSRNHFLAIRYYFYQFNLASLHRIQNQAVILTS
ncbi:IS1 family transposase [Flavilitoribacter nigricans]|uniref:IS1 family transposase n=1 Tax=Flavilitoribacter nigricans (strain ATCC 23147 / DSM 23189 / NBRC 102662 / NCIMB 1420 / SS-2) TaxID=1122177 RepID=A0A2D0N1H5_FLAN2|nr:IS1 family transposase [Flavilitoribacter nigricans]PHN02381.1 IS1 family transposase [Flavilitoribacter nigricans DSM 23189 = NBRC 102662]